MNLDNQRLKDIQRFKTVYTNELLKADTISDCILFQSKIDELEAEEKEILKRCDVRI